MKMMISTSEKLDDPPHHPGARALPRVNSTRQDHKLLSLDYDEVADGDELNDFCSGHVQE